MGREAPTCSEGYNKQLNLKSQNAETQHATVLDWLLYR